MSHSLCLSPGKGVEIEAPSPRRFSRAQLAVHRRAPGPVPRQAKLLAKTTAPPTAFSDRSSGWWIWAALGSLGYLTVADPATFSQLLAFSGAARGLVAWAAGFDLAPATMMRSMFAVLLLDMFMEQISIML